MSTVLYISGDFRCPYFLSLQRRGMWNNFCWWRSFYAFLAKYLILIVKYRKSLSEISNRHFSSEKYQHLGTTFGAQKINKKHERNGKKMLNLVKYQLKCYLPFWSEGYYLTISKWEPWLFCCTGLLYYCC